MFKVSFISSRSLQFAAHIASNIIIQGMNTQAMVPTGKIRHNVKRHANFGIKFRSNWKDKRFNVSIDKSEINNVCCSTQKANIFSSTIMCRGSSDWMYCGLQTLKAIQNFKNASRPAFQRKIHYLRAVISLLKSWTKIKYAQCFYVCFFMFE